MKVFRLAPVLLVIVAVGCGGGTVACTSSTTFTGIYIIPQTASADHALAAPANQVTFRSYAISSDSNPGCTHAATTPTPVNASWSVSDSVAVSLVVPGQSTGTVVATCVLATPQPVTITALTLYGVVATPLRATATLACQ